MSTTALLVEGWFDGEQHHPGTHTLQVQAGRVSAIDRGDHGAALAAQGAELVRGAFLMPGLVDAHVHLFLDGAPTEAAVRSAHMKQGVEQLTEAARASARQSLACGVTRVRDAGDRHDINNVVREEARDGLARMARVRSGGRGIKRAKRYGAFMAGDVADDPDIISSVTALAQRNDEIKLILTGIIDFDAGTVTDEPQFSTPEARLVVQTAHAQGRKVFAHCSGVKGLAVAAAAGVDSIEHGFFMNRDTLLQMRDHGLAWTPTFCPVHFQWAQPEAVGWSANTVGHLRRILDSHAEHLRLAHELGVTLLLGTDAGSMGVQHGHAVFEEIDRYLEAGLPLAAVLRAATFNNRHHFGHGQPRLAVGAPFDAVLLKGSPFDDVGALRQPQQVWLGPDAEPGR
jgi:imidazolonepropionase-like amidohydrolase